MLWRTYLDRWRTYLDGNVGTSLIERRGQADKCAGAGRCISRHWHSGIVVQAVVSRVLSFSGLSSC